MGIYLNPGIANLKRDKTAELYVDKSMMISFLDKKLDTQDSYICVSRPRRFGKTMAANMIAAYYSKDCDSHEVFSDLKTSKGNTFEDYINKYNVLMIDCAGMYNNKPDDWSTSKMITESIVSEFRQYFTNLFFPDNCTLAQAITIANKNLGEKFILILDEYDILIRENDSKELQSYLKLLNGLFKDNSLRSSIVLAYISGILPIIKDTVQSKLNNFNEFTMLDVRELAPYIGFTREETKLLVAKANMDMAKLERRYDGYCVDGVELYSPKSVIEALNRRKCGAYWTQTGSFEAISNYISMNIEGIKDDVFVYLIHLGYLAYNGENKTCRIPNNEIKNQ